MDRIRTGDFGSGNDPVGFQIGLLARSGPDADGVVRQLHVHRIHIGFGINSDGFHIEFAARADDAEGDFTAVGNQDTLEHGRGLAGFQCSIFNVKTAGSLDAEKHVAVLHGGGIFGNERTNGTGFLGFDLIHHLHGLDDAKSLAF